MQRGAERCVDGFERRGLQRRAALPGANLRGVLGHLPQNGVGEAGNTRPLHAAALSQPPKRRPRTRDAVEEIKLVRRDAELRAHVVIERLETAGGVPTDALLEPREHAQRPVDELGREPLVAGLELREPRNLRVERGSGERAVLRDANEDRRGHAPRRRLGRPAQGGAPSARCVVRALMAWQPQSTEELAELDDDDVPPPLHVVLEREEHQREEHRHPDEARDLAHAQRQRAAPDPLDERRTRGAPVEHRVWAARLMRPRFTLMSAIAQTKYARPLRARLPGDVVERDRPADVREAQRPCARRTTPITVNSMTLPVSSKPAARARRSSGLRVAARGSLRVPGPSASVRKT